MHVCAPCASLVPEETRKGHIIPWTRVTDSCKLSYRCWIDAGNWVQVLSKRSQYLWPLSHLSSPQVTSFFKGNLNVGLHRAHVSGLRDFSQALRCLFWFSGWLDHHAVSVIISYFFENMLYLILVFKITELFMVFLYILHIGWYPPQFISFKLPLTMWESVSQLLE